MLKRVEGFFTYENSSQGTLDRDAFEATIRVEMALPLAVPNSRSPLCLTSAFVTNDAIHRTLEFLVFYNSDNSGSEAADAFWMACQNHKALSTVIFPSNIKRCDSFHDVDMPCVNWVEEGK